MEIARPPGLARVQPAVALMEKKVDKEAEEKECLLASATSQNRLAKLYQARGEFTRAEQLSDQCLETEKKLFGEGHPRYIAARLNHAAALAYQGKHQQAIAEATAATDQGAPAGHLLYDAARVYAVCSGAVAKDTALPQARRDELSEQYAARSVQTLGKAAAARFFDAPEKIDNLKKDEAFVPLRSRGDFRKLLQALEGAVRDGP
jgi:tetratricopeptide (TPR) repeat protein